MESTEKKPVEFSIKALTAASTFNECATAARYYWLGCDKRPDWLDPWSERATAAFKTIAAELGFRLVPLAEASEAPAEAADDLIMSDR